MFTCMAGKISLQYSGLTQTLKVISLLLLYGIDVRVPLIAAIFVVSNSEHAMSGHCIKNN